MDFFRGLLGGDMMGGFAQGMKMAQMEKEMALQEQKVKQEYELNKMLKEEQALKIKAQRNQMESAAKIADQFKPQEKTVDTGLLDVTTTVESPLLQTLRKSRGDEFADLIGTLAQYDPTAAIKMIMEKPKDRYMNVAEGGSVFDTNTNQMVFQGTPKGNKPISVAPGATLVDPVTNQPIYQNPNKPDKAPAGYRFTGNGDMEAVPGGPADIKGQNAASQAFASLSNANEALNRLEVAVKTLKDHPGLSRITGVMSKLPNMPGSNAANAQALLENIKSQAGFTVLQNMRDMSKTGGALGQVSDFENKMLQANLAALDNVQSTAAFKTALDTIQKYVSGAKTRLQRAYDQSYYGKKSQVTRPTDAAPPVAGARQAGDGNWYVPDPNRPGKYLKVVK